MANMVDVEYSSGKGEECEPKSISQCKGLEPADISHDEVGNELDSTDQSGLQLLDLPNEVLVQMISWLDSESPVDVAIIEQPSLSIGKSSMSPIKQVSVLSHRLRTLARPILFRHMRLDPYNVTAFLDFVDINQLKKYVVSLVAYPQGPCSHHHPAWWARLLDQLPATTLTIICAPYVFAELSGVNISGNDSWAFNMPYQIMRLQQSTESAHQHISSDNPRNILIARPWTSLTINEGSFLKAYTTYEYFLRRTPSLLGSLHQTRSVEADAMFARLIHFSFVAIFPFYNHVDEVLNSVRKMLALETLTLKLCPQPESPVLADEIEEAQGHFDVNDPWNEFDTSINLVSRTIILLTVEGRLKELRIDDVKMEGIRQSLEDKVSQDLRPWWTYNGGGSWQRSKVAIPRAV